MFIYVRKKTRVKSRRNIIFAGNVKSSIWNLQFHLYKSYYLQDEWTAAWNMSRLSRIFLSYISRKIVASLAILITTSSLMAGTTSGDAASPSEETVLSNQKLLRRCLFNSTQKSMEFLETVRRNKRSLRWKFCFLTCIFLSVYHLFICFTLLRCIFVRE